MASTTQSAQAETSYQSSPCEEVIADAANRANIIPDEIEWYPAPYGSDPWAQCAATYTWHTDGAEWEGEEQSASFMISRGEGVGLVDRLTCGTQLACEETTFHGYPAKYYQAYSQGGLFGFVWYLEQNGFTYVLRVERGETIYGSYADVIVEKDEVMEAAESLWSAFDSAVPAASQDPVVTDPGDQPDDVPTIPEDQPGDDIPTVPVVPTGRDQPASLGPLATTPVVPLAGALIGTVIGWLVSVATTSGNVLKTLGTPPLKTAQPPAIPADPETGAAKDQGLYWSERPWDQAGPGYVSKEEYEQTKDMLEQGYKWTNGGWQTPDQISQSDQWQQNNNEATAREDAELQSKMEAERQALEQNKAELKKTADELQAAENMPGLKDDLETINQNLQDENIYVLNPYQGDPTVAFHRLNALKNLVWDNTAGHLTGSNGLTCEGYVEKTSQAVIETVSERFPGATVERVIFEEKSTVNSKKDWGNWFDSLIDDNHNLTKITLPDGSEWALDYHQQNAGNSPLLRPWKEATEEWRVYMGKDEFVERVSATIKTVAPQPRK
ncbi:MAG: hypothetical protein EHM33_21210 [Chloroflexi bacterium]|nr:MAG: hypothetical protein EHM33_21210 [Chloroflexota bacterium]